MSLPFPFFIETVEKLTSEFSGEIEVRKFRGEYTVIAGRVNQSGDLVKKLWQSSLSYLLSLEGLNFSPKNVLILGFGAGSAAQLVSELWPRAKITGVEIDKTMIDIGKRYFGTTEISLLEIIEGDAYDIVAEKITKVEKDRDFDLILVDTYKGQEFPERLERVDFFENLKTILKPNGWAIFNRLYYGEHRKGVENFNKKVVGLFSRVETKIWPAGFGGYINLLIYVQK